MKIKVVRIGGTSYSGSTMLDLMLGNAGNAFSCGEIFALFRPTLPKHHAPQCGCSDPNCKIWDIVKAGGEERIWSTLKTMNPESWAFIDSSKNLKWFEDQEKHYDKSIIPLNVLIWKTPEEFAYSCLKRNEENVWKKKFINYHITYFQQMKKWISVSYRNLVKNPSQNLKILCDKLGMDYFQGKENYWEKNHHTLFGSSTAKLHLYAKDSGKFNEMIHSNAIHKSMTRINVKRGIERHREIHADNNIRSKLPLKTLKTIDKDKRIKAITHILRNTEVNAVSYEEIESVVEKLRPVRKSTYFAPVLDYFHSRKL